MLTIEEYAKEVDLQDKLQQEYFKKRRANICDKILFNRCKAQEAKVRHLTASILNPDPTLSLF